MKQEVKFITMDELVSLEQLETHIIFSDEFQELPKNRQYQIYNYCNHHASNHYCRMNLKQIYNAVAKLYFNNNEQ